MALVSTRSASEPERPLVLERMAGRLAERPFQPHRLLPSAHLQTIVASRMPREFSWGWQRSREHLLELSNGGRVRSFLVERSPDARVVVGLHGLGGSSDSLFLQGLSHKAYREGWNSVLFNLYDLNLSGRSPTLFHAGASQHVEELLERIREIRPWDRVCLTGISLGGNLLLKLLGHWGGAPPSWVEATAVISPLVDMVISWSLIEKPANLFYRLYFISRLKRIIRERSQDLGRFIDLEALAKIRTIREFDECVTAPMGGYADALDYYRRASSAPLLGRIRKPTLVIHAKDDPILPWEPWTRPGAVSNPYLLPHLSEKGGHVGFIEQTRRDIDRVWAENRVIDFFRLLP